MGADYFGGTPSVCDLRRAILTDMLSIVIGAG